MLNEITFGLSHHLSDRRMMPGHYVNWNDNYRIADTPDMIINTGEDTTYSTPNLFQKEAAFNTAIYSNATLANAFSAGINALNGKIYFIPEDEVYVLELDPTQTQLKSTTFGSLSGTTKWLGGVLAPNGLIYGIPYSSLTWLRINPYNRTAVAFTAGASVSGLYKGGILTPNGLIVAPSGNNASGITRIMVFNPATETFVELDVTLNAIGVAYNGSCLAPNGIVYFTPQSDDIVGAYDAETKKYKEYSIPSQGIGTNLYDGSVLGPDGNIYFIPRNATRVLVFNPISNTGKFIGPDLGTVSSKWKGGVLAPDGYIYGIPLSDSRFLKIDWKNHTVVFVGSIAGSGKFSGATIASTGNMYTITSSSDTIAEIKFNMPIKNNAECRKEVNKY